MVKEAMAQPGQVGRKAARAALEGRTALLGQMSEAACMEAAEAKEMLVSPQTLVEAEQSALFGPGALALSHPQMFVPQTTQQAVSLLRRPEPILG
jgi:hypothetical protein